MQKRGQTTLFVIIGIIIVIAIALVFLIRPTAELRQAGTEAEINIKEFTESCVEDVGRDALKFIGLQGGYNHPPEGTNPAARFSQVNGAYSIPHWAIGSALIAPSFERIEQEINSYYDENFADCIQGYDQYATEGWTIETEEIEVEVDFQDGETGIIATYPVTATKAGTEIKFDTLTPIIIPWDVKGLVETMTEVAIRYGRTGLDFNYVESQGYFGYTQGINGGTSRIFRAESAMGDEERNYVLLILLQ